MKFNGAMWGTTFGFFLLVAVWVAITEDRQFPYLNVAFVVSVLVANILVMGIMAYAKRRPVGARTSWGEAMVGSTVVFFILFWIYGVVPHQFLVFADSELNWRSDRFLVGPPLFWDSSQNLLQWMLPFDITYRVLRDILVVVIYNLYLAGNIATFSIWQNRGKELPSTDLENKSQYGRPLVKTSKPEPAGV